MTNDGPTGLPDVEFLRTVAKEFRESGSAKVADGVARAAEALRLASMQLNAIAEALDMPKEAWRIAGCDVLAHQVRDLLRNYMVLTDKYGSEHDLVARQIVGTSEQVSTDDYLPPDSVLLQQADDMRHALELDRQEALMRSETERTDPGTEKLLRDLLDRGYKMHVMAGTVRVAEQNPDHNDPLIAWLSDVRSILYGNTKPTPEAPLG